PARARRSVVFPEPFGPRTATVSLWPTEGSTWSCRSPARASTRASRLTAIPWCCAPDPSPSGELALAPGCALVPLASQRAEPPVAQAEQDGEGGSQEHEAQHDGGARISALEADVHEQRQGLCLP